MSPTRLQRHQRAKSARKTLAAMLAMGALVVSSLTGAGIVLGAPQSAAALAGNPGSLSAPKVLFHEDFENKTGDDPRLLSDYVGADGTTYTADPAWLTNCNGVVLDLDSPPSGRTGPAVNSCAPGGEKTSDTPYLLLRHMADVLGVNNGSANSAKNHVVGAYTHGRPPGADKTVLQTSPIPLPTALGRYLSFSMSAAAVNCGWGAPRYDLFFVNASGDRTRVGSTVNACTSDRVIMGVPVGDYSSNGAVLFSSTSVRLAITNENWYDGGNDGAFDDITILDATPQLDMQFDPPLVQTGTTSTLTFTVTNTSELGAKNGWSFTDTLPSGLLITDPANVGGTCAATKAVPAGSNKIVVTDGQLPDGAASCTITVPVTSASARSYTDESAAVTTVGLDMPGDARVQFTDPTYTVQKRVDSSVANPGKAVTYTVTVTNTGDWAYNDDAPADRRRASFTDNLADVLDDATYNGDASDGATVTGNSLSWSGTLDKGQSRTITYSVTPNRPGPGSKVLNGTVTPTGSGGACVPSGCTTSTPVQFLHITKTADKADVVPGATITYTIVVENDGAADYTANAPASFTDDLTKILDDVHYRDDAAASAGSVSYSRPTLTWSGALAAGARATITYSGTVETPDRGDKQIDNTVVSSAPGANCPPGSTDTSCTARLSSASFTVKKTSSAAAVNPGDVVTYSVTVTNTGQIPYTASSPARFTDDLSTVLDDAAYNGDASNGATVTGDTLSWAGPLAVGASTTVAYSVTVRNPDTGDNRLTNTVTPQGPDGYCELVADCTTTTSVRAYSVAKVASTPEVAPGGVVTYTVTVTNTGQADYTDQVPATFTDDLSNVLDEAAYNGDATNGAVLRNSNVYWSGPLPVGQSIQIRYSVTVNSPDVGDKSMANAVTPTGPGGSCAAPGECSTTTAVKTFTVTKEASSAVATPGAPITYTVKVTNTGTAAYTTSAPAAFVDDLSNVLDDAVYNGDAVSSSDAADPGVVNFAAPKLTWSGPLAVGATVTVTYTVTVNTPVSGDTRLVNAVTTSTPGCEGDCTPTTDTPIQAISFTKTTDATEVVPGENVTYTITAKNTGQVAYTAQAPATFTDDLTQVLDDAAYNNDATATSGTMSYQSPVLSWSGPVGVGETVTITYTVTVHTPDTGDKVLDNTVVSTVPGSSCSAKSADPACRSVVPAGSFAVSKTASTVKALQGSTITYTVTVTNTGKLAYTQARPASFRDDLTQVLDDATYNGDISTTGGTAAYERSTLTWAGPLAVGGTVTVTYSVTVNTPDTGDRRAVNSVIPTSPGGECAATACTTTTEISAGFAVHTGGAPLAQTGTAPGWMTLSGAGIAALLAGAAIWARRRFSGMER